MISRLRCSAIQRPAASCWNSALSSRRADHILLRKGQTSDCPEIARLAHAAGGDVIQFTVGGLRPGLDALDVYREMVAEPDGPFSFERCVVAVVRGAVVGVANAFPARLIRNEFPVLMSERELLLNCCSGSSR